MGRLQREKQRVSAPPKSFDWGSVQISFIHDVYRYGSVFAIGGRRSGKSVAAVEAARQCAFEWEPGVTGIMAAPTLGQLERNYLTAWRELVPRDRYEHVKDPISPHLLCDVGNGVYTTIYLASGNNPGNIEGATAGWACFTELQQGKKFWDIVRPRVSEKKAKKLRWFGDGLPEEGWLSTEFSPFRSDGRPSAYRRVVFTTYDNQTNLADGYIDKMMEVWTPREVKMYIHGMFVGAIDSVYPDFSRGIHAAARVGFVPGYRIYVGLDFNLRQQSAVLCQYINGVFRVFDEIMEPGTVTAQSERLQKRLAKYGVSHKNRKQVVLCPDASGQYASHQRGDSSIAILEGDGFHVLCDNANPAINDRDTSLNVLLCNGKDESHFLIDPVRCPRTIESLSGLRVKERDKKDELLTDAADATGYAVWQVAPRIRDDHAENANRDYLQRIGPRAMRR